jgi:hypothetical protein
MEQAGDGRRDSNHAMGITSRIGVGKHAERQKREDGPVILGSMQTRISEKGGHSCMLSARPGDRELYCGADPIRDKHATSLVLPMSGSVWSRAYFFEP